jgi:hypothetical protein
MKRQKKKMYPRPLKTPSLSTDPSASSRKMKQDEKPRVGGITEESRPSPDGPPAPHTPSSKREEEIATSFSKNGENPRDNTSRVLF